MNQEYQKRMEQNVSLYLWIQPFLGLMFTVPVWVAFQQRFLTYSGMALMEAATFLIIMLFELPSGVMADVIGRRKTLIIGWIVVFAGFIIEGFSFSLWIMLLGFFLVAVGAAFVSGAEEAIFYDSLKELGREKEFPKLNARGLLLFRSAMILAMFTGGYLYSLYFGLPYIMRGLGVLVAVFLAYNMLEPNIDTVTYTIKSYMAKLRAGVAELLKNSYSKALSVYYILIAGVSWSCLYYFNNPIANDVGYTPQEQSYLFGGLYIVTTSVLTYVVTKKRFLEKRTVFIAFPTFLLIGLLPGIFATKVLVVPLLAFVIIAGGARYAILNSFVNEEISSSNRATSLSALSLIVSLFCAVLIGTMGPVQDIFGTQMVFTILGATILLIGIPATLEVLKHLSDTKN